MILRPVPEGTMWRRCVIATALAPLLSACGSSPSSSTAATPATLRASVGVTSISVSGESRAVGQAYRVVVHLHESTGTAATIAAVDLTLLNGSTAILSSHADRPIADEAAANVCPGNGSVDTREFLVVDGDASHPYATSIQARVTFSDSSSVVGTTSATTGVPALPVPMPQTFTLTGLVTDANTHTGIAGARVEVMTGLNQGQVAFADGGGTYVLKNLAADTFRLRASATDHDSGEQGVTVPANPRADFELRPPLPNYAGVWTGTYDISTCLDVTPPDQMPLYLCRQFAPTISGPPFLTYRFTLSQTGATVVGPYKLVSPMFDCPCGGDYGTFDMSGTIMPDGTLVLSGGGTARGSGVQATTTFTLRMTGPSTITGSVTGTLSIASSRATFSSTRLSGTR
jgi:hypothetical protein